MVDFPAPERPTSQSTFGEVWFMGVISSEGPLSIAWTEISHDSNRIRRKPGEKARNLACELPTKKDPGRSPRSCLDASLKERYPPFFL